MRLSDDTDTYLIKKSVNAYLSHYAKDICIRITIVNDGGGKKKLPTMTLI